MFNSPLDIRINAQRFRTDFEALSRIGATSESGASHSPREFTIWEDCVNGVNVLIGAALRMAGVISN